MDAIRIVLASIRKADNDFNLINDNDKICLGISGGKDSMAMFYVLNLYKKFSKTKFEIYPCIIDLGFENFDATELKKYIDSFGYNLKILDGRSVYEILKAQQKLQKTPHLPCSICSKMKKAIINKAAHDLNCNKVAFAHHRDDALETLFMNQIYGGRISTFEPKMFLSNEKITFIRPLILLKETDLNRLCEEQNIPVFSSHCPNDKYTEREEIKNILHDIYIKYPSSRENFLNMLLNHDKENIFYQHVDNKIEGTKISYNKVVSIQDFKEYISFKENSKTTTNKELNNYYLIRNNGKTSATLELSEDNKNRQFLVVNYAYKNIKTLSIFIKKLINNLYDLYNPCILNMNILNKEDAEEFIKLGFKKIGSKKYQKEIKIIEKK